MQVMNNDQFNQNEILIGGSGKTISAKVSDDPMLMSMLSTGFYANPHRAMIQETMFNAWDAHRMGNCQDTPIDIYINEHSGFTVRDYGPGIAHEKMESVYFTYAASTKRDQADMTGGFGLGSKSPWSYTESFTVTSHHAGVKSMYLMSRVSDEVEGKPGMTPLMSFETDETGLSVSIPLEDGSSSLIQTHKTVKDVLYLSGIKARIHYEDDDPLVVDSMEVASAQYVMDTREGHHERKIYAVYGGVRYEIVDKDEYTEEFAFMNMISEISSLFIGFAPHSLSPLPNREGLNMSTNTKENIRVGLELCMERFQSVFEPVIHAFFRDRMDHYKEQEIEPHFALFHAVTKNGMGSHFMNQFEEKMKPLLPLNTDKTVWEIALRLLVRSPGSIIKVIGEERWRAILVQHFIRVYPDAKQLGFNILKKPIDDIISNSHRHESHIEEMIAGWVMPNQMSRLFEFEEQLLKEFPEDKGFARPKVRLKADHDWPAMERHRNAPKGIAHRFMGRSTRPIGTKAPKAQVKFLDPTQLWSSKDGDPVHQFFLNNTVVLAKTVNALRDTDVRVNQYFSKNSSYLNDYFYHHDFGMIPAYVVHSRKGWYDKALEVLTNLGFNVIEANEPESRVYGNNDKPRMIVKQYCRVNTARNDWKASEIDPDDEDYDLEEDGVPLTDPTHFLYVKQSDLEGYSYRDYSKPSKTLMSYMLKLNPDIAMVNNQTQADKLAKDGAKPFHEFVIDWKKAMDKKVYRLRNIVRVIRVLNKSNIPVSMIKDPQIQAAMGIAKVKPDDSSFWEEMHIINAICEEHYSPLRTTASEMQTLVDKVWDADPQKGKIKKAIKVTGLLSENALETQWRRLDKAEHDDFASKLARFIRTM